MQKISKDTKILIIFTILIVIGYTFGFLFVEWFHQTVHHFDLYRQSITVFLGAILAAILTVTIFYMGKFHDYQRQFTTKKGQFKEGIEQVKISHEDFKETISELQMKIELIKNSSYLEKVTKQMEELINSKKIDEAIAKMEKFPQKLLQIADEFKKFPKNMIKSLIIDVSPFAGGFGYMSMINLDPTLGRFYYLLILLTIAISSFLHSWYSHERKMMILHEYHELVTDSLTHTRIIKYQIEQLKLRAERLVELILFREKEVTPTEKKTQNS